MYTTIAASAAGIGTAASLAYPNGFQPEHYEYFLQENRALRPGIAVLGLFLGNDLESDVRESLIERDRSDGRIVSVTVPYRRTRPDGTAGVSPLACSIWFYPLCSAARFLVSAQLVLNTLNRLEGVRDVLYGAIVPNSPNGDALEAGRATPYSDRALRSIERIKDMVEARGGHLIVLLITPRKFHAADASTSLGRSPAPAGGDGARRGGVLSLARDFCRERRIECMDFVDLLGAEDFFRVDAHWNRSGHRKVGERVAHRLKELSTAGARRAPEAVLRADGVAAGRHSPVSARLASPAPQRERPQGRHGLP